LGLPEPLVGDVDLLSHTDYLLEVLWQERRALGEALRVPLGVGLLVNLVVLPLVRLEVVGLALGSLERLDLLKDFVGLEHVVLGLPVASGPVVNVLLDPCKGGVAGVGLVEDAVELRQRLHQQVVAVRARLVRASYDVHQRLFRRTLVEEHLPPLTCEVDFELVPFLLSLRNLQVVEGTPEALLEHGIRHAEGRGQAAVPTESVLCLIPTPHPVFIH